MFFLGVVSVFSLESTAPQQADRWLAFIFVVLLLFVPSAIDSSCILFWLLFVSFVAIPLPLRYSCLPAGIRVSIEAFFGRLVGVTGSAQRLFAGGST